MRVLSGIVLSIVLLLSSAAFVYADKQTVEELVSEWIDEGYPEYIGGAEYIGDGVYMVYLAGDAKESSGEIKAVCANLVDLDNIHFEYVKYSYNELVKVYTEILSKYSKENYFRGASISISSNCVFVTVDQVMLYNGQAFDFQGAYGELVSVDAELKVDPNEYYVVKSEADERLARYDLVLWIGMLIIVPLLVALVVLAIVRRNARKKDDATA